MSNSSKPQRITRGFSMDDNGSSGETPPPRRVRTRQQIISGEGKRPPAAVELKLLAHNPFNPREQLTEIEETAASLQERGQLQPVAVVRRAAFLSVHPGQEADIGEAEYVVIDGNRRLAAATEAGLAELRIDVNDDLAASAEDMLEAGLIANIHRVDVPPIDQAHAIEDLLAKHGSQENVAKRLGKSGAWVSQRLALLELTPDLQKKVETGELKVKEGRRIGRLPAGKQREEADKALNRVKAPRKPRGSSTSNQPAPVPPQSTTQTPSPALPLNPVKTETTPRPLNPVKSDEDTEPSVPWDDPELMREQIVARMDPINRRKLTALLLQYNSKESEASVS
ncbi:ParB/RepB/Spo0J family partition protein [Streptomyces sp. NPDC093109]|uniref:ParB/RepB/Spo0J family partition protein n=1 Tax=Streptomyces sp. NPDC093109 TaxID=3154977 RepID=UPI00344DD363